MFREFFAVTGLPADAGFPMFGTGHFCWLAAAAAVAAAGALWYPRLSETGRRRARRTLCWGIVALDLFKDVYFVAFGVFSYDFLPFHLCGMAIYISLLHAYFPGRIKGELLYSLCMPGAAAALLFPGWTGYPLWNVATLQCFLIHILLFAYPVMLLASGELLPRARNLPWCLLFLLAVSPPVYLFNRAFGTDFMFINAPLDAQPFLLYVRLFGRSFYVLGMLFTLFAVWALLYGVPWTARKLFIRKV